MNRLRELREKRRLSLRDLAEKVNISASALSLIEHEKRGLNNADIETLCTFFNVSADELLGRNTPTTIQQLSGTQLALYNGSKDLTDDQLKEVLNFVEFVKSKK